MGHLSGACTDTRKPPSHRCIWYPSNHTVRVFFPQRPTNHIRNASYFGSSSILGEWISGNQALRISSKPLVPTEGWMNLFFCRTNTLPETNSSPLKMDGWNTSIVSFWDGLFSVAMLVSGRVLVLKMVLHIQLSASSNSLEHRYLWEIFS